MSNELRDIRDKADTANKEIRRLIMDLRALMDNNGELVKTDEAVVATLDNTCNRLRRLL